MHFTHFHLSMHQFDVYLELVYHLAFAQSVTISHIQNDDSGKAKSLLEERTKVVQIVL